MANKIVGTPGDDVLKGTKKKDIIKGKGGNDVLIGKGGNDKLKGGGGNDVLKGKSGNDALFGGSGDDDLIGGAGHDDLLGNAGLDLLFGGKGSDWMAGGSGADIFKFNDGDGFFDNLYPGSWDDVIFDYTDGVDQFDFSGVFNASDGAIVPNITLPWNFFVNVDDKVDPEWGSGAEIDYGSSSVFVIGYSLAQASDFDFIFA